MLKKDLQRVKIHQVIESQLPSFVLEENPLFVEFLKQYYISQDSEGSVVDLCENIDRFINLENFDGNSFTEVYTTLTTEIDYYNSTIQVVSTDSWPKTYGLLKIDNEIITYTSKDSTHFYGCVRGFSGIESLHSQINPKELVFSETETESHVINAKVHNLSNLVFVEIWKKLKNQFLPGFQDLELYPGIDKATFLSKSNDFYRTKGSVESLKILFKVLYGESDLKVIKPSEYLIKASDSQWSITDNLIVEVILGDITKINGQQITQQNPYASGNVYLSTLISVGEIAYYEISLSNESKVGKFKACPATRIVSPVASTDTSITVDSTIGFDSVGELLINGNYIKYNGTASTQFLNCEIVDSIDIYSNVYQNYFIVSYEDGDTTKPVYMRVSSVLSNTDDILNKSRYMVVGDEIGVRTLGEDIEPNREFYKNRTDNWLYNNNYEIELVNSPGGITITSNPATINTKIPHRFKLNDSVTILDVDTYDTFTNPPVTGRITQILSETSFIFEFFSGTLYSNLEYIVRKNIKFYSLSGQNYVTDVQNTYIDKKSENIYVASSSIASYITSEIDYKKYFSINQETTIITTVNKFGSTVNHNFYTGDKVYFSYTSGNVGVNSGTYFVKKVSDTTLRLAYNLPKIYQDDYIIFRPTGISTYSNSLILKDLRNKEISDQKLLKRVAITPKLKQSNFTLTKTSLPASVGILLNGTEVVYSKSPDKVHYGQLTSISVNSFGSGYDVINPPNVVIDDSNVGYGASAIVQISGSLSEIQLINSGYDYVKAPTVKIYGGNGKNATAEAIIKDITTVINFRGSSIGVNTTSNTIGFTTYHNLNTGEEIIYKSYLNAPIGIGTAGAAAAGESDTKAYLIDRAHYFVIKNDDYSIKLTNNLRDAVANQNIINLTQVSDGNHTLISTKVRKIVDRIVVTNPGEGYQNKSVRISSTLYPPTQIAAKNTTLVGINTHENYIYAKNHNFESGDLVTYSTTNTQISGLSTSQNYYVIKLDNDKFRLASAGIGTTLSNVKYLNNNYSKLYTAGSGNHTFAFPPIVLEITGIPNSSGVSGISTETPSSLISSQASGIPIVLGKVTNVFLADGGYNYGSPNILNHNRVPIISLDSGSGAEIRPIIVNGGISDVYIVKKGTGYVAPPKLVVSGSGSYAELLAVVVGGEIVSVKIINSGSGYLRATTEISIITKGSGVSLSANIQIWHVNLFEKYRYVLDDQVYKSDAITIPSFDKNINTGQLVSPIVPRKLRYLLGDNIDENLNTTINLSHSPIVGWAYDGNPIYGNYGSSNPEVLENIRELQSSYVQVEKLNRPNFTLGFFIEDYEYTASGDLDEFNGRFCITPEFPQGTYAYFSTKNNYPYVLYDFVGEADLYNYDSTKNQISGLLESGDIIRNSSPYNINEEYSNYGGINLNYSKNAKSLVRAIYKTGIDSIEIVNSGQDYKVGDQIVFDNNLTGGRGLNAKISEVVGRGVSFVSYTRTYLNNIEFVESGGLILGISSIPHNLVNEQIITISGINTASYKFIEGTHTVSVSTSFTTLSVGIGTSGVTGLTTFIKISEPPISRKVQINDILVIGSEKFLVLNTDTSKNNYKVLRGYNSTTIGIHTATESVELLPKKFTFASPSGIKTDSSTEINRIKYFNPQTDVGVGINTTINYVGYGFTQTIIGIQTSLGSYTNLVFYRHSFKIGDIIELSGATNIIIPQAQVVSTTPTSITVNYDSTALAGAVGIGTTTLVTQKKYNKISPQNIYMPGHGFYHGQRLRYLPISGIGLTCSINYSLTPEFNLSSGSIVYVVKDDNDNFGISTTHVGIGSTVGKLYFKSLSTFNGQTNSLETTIDNPIGEIVSLKGTVTTFDNHNLLIGDKINFNITPNLTENVTLKFDDSSARLLINPVSIASTQFIVPNGNVIVSNHSFKTGDKIVYNANSPATPLISGEEYFVIKIDSNIIRLSEYYNDAISINYNSIGISTCGVGTHTISLINPPLKFTRGNTVKFNIADNSLRNLVLDFYLDSSFTAKISQENIRRIGSPGDSNANTAVYLDLDENISNILYYKLIPVGISTITNNAGAYNVDTDVLSYCRILVEKSYYNSEYDIISVGNTTASFNLDKTPESSNYNLSGISTVFYYTSSPTATGPIHSISIGYSGTGYKTLPNIVSIESQNGYGAIIRPKSNSIGSVKNLVILNSGYDFPTDPSFPPKADVPFSLRVSNNYELDEITVVEKGINYLIAPKFICPQHPELQFTSFLEGNNVKSVRIDINKSGLSEVAPEIICLNNSNGVQITNAYSNLGVNTIEIFPQTGDFIEFPFDVGDEVFIEGVELIDPTSSDSGYNSVDYNYKTFTITNVSNVAGAESISYSIVGYGITGGIYDPDNSVGRVIKYDDIAKVTATMKKSDFIENETIFNNGDIFKVQKSGWNKEKNILKISGNETYLSIGSSIVGKTSNSRATIEEITSTQSSYYIGGEYRKENGWRTKSGFLNENAQRMHDSNYYQNFSYSLNSKILKTKWSDSVESLAHPAGFKLFGDLSLNSTPELGIGRSNNLKISVNNLSDLLITIQNTLSFQTKQNFDVNYEIVTSKGISKIIGFLSKKLIDYAICKTNKVLKIDDISPQFNGTSLQELRGRYADAAGLLSINRQFIQNEVVGFITSTYPAILSNVDYDQTICKRDIGLVVDAISRDLKYGGNINSLNGGLSYWNAGVSYVSGESTETIAGYRYIVDLSKYIINNVAITTSYQVPSFSVPQTYNQTIPYDTSCSQYSYDENCCADVQSAIGSYVGIITSIIGIGTTAAPLASYPDIARGGNVVGVSSFFINSNNSRLLCKYFIAQNSCAVGSSFVNLPNHNFNSGEELIYDPGAGGTTIAIASTNGVKGGITTDFMPTTVYAYRVDSNRIKLSGIKTDAVANGKYFTFRDLGSGLGVGSGTTHSLSVITELANVRSLISVDSIIQSPLYAKKISTSLASPIAIGDTTVKLTGITSISSNLFLKIDDEIIKINTVGFGSTNALTVDRGSMGSVATSHTVGSAVTVMAGDYNINQGKIHFSSPPYGKVGPAGLSTNSSFSGRIFYRLNYDNTYIFDDISNNFNGANQAYELSYYGKDVTGIVTNLGSNVVGPNYGVILINNILQKPSIDYSMTERAAIGIGGSIKFKGVDVLSLPKGGFINEVISGFGSGYQPLVPAFASPVISGSGTIQSLIIQSNGSGYRSNVSVEVISNVGSGASIVALVGTGASVGIITGFNIISAGSGYTSTNLPATYVGFPTAYSNMRLSGGSGTNARINVTVGSGGSVTRFEITNRGLGYKPNDLLTLQGIPFAVGVGTSSFNFRVKDILSDKFSGWTFGNLTALDDISDQFNGVAKSFLLTKTDITTERYNISVLPGSDIKVENTLIIILNDVLQSPGENYSLIAGERLVFTTPPPLGSKCLIFFYKASPFDVVDVNSLNQVKVGDTLTLNKKDQYVRQLDRVVSFIESIAEAKTTNYIDVGINTDPTFYRTGDLTKQSSDLIINNSYVSKARLILEGRITPASRIIKKVTLSDVDIYVENAFPLFRKLDNLDQLKNSVTIINDTDTRVARVSAVVSAAGTITDFTIIDGGENYSNAPEITISSSKSILPQYGKNWTTGSIKTGSESFNSFAIGNGIYVACRGLSGIPPEGGISTSTNFVDWVNQTPLGATDFNSVSYGNNSWVVVGSAGSIYTSSTSNNWQRINTFLSRVYVGGIIPFEYPVSSYNGNLNGVTFGMNKFIAVGAGGSALVSDVSSGITTSWVVRSTPSATQLNSIAAGTDNYVAVGNNGYVTRSSDGFVWQSHVSNTANQLNSVKFINQKFFAVGNSGTLIVSTDGGGSWVNKSPSGYTSFNFFDITYKDGVFLISGTNQLIIISSDGENWIRTTNSNVTLKFLGTDRFRIIGVGESCKYSVTDSEVVKASATTTISAGGTVQSITVTEPGFGYDETVGVNILIAPETLFLERLDNVDSTGDFGTIVGIGTSIIGISTTSPMIKFDINSDNILNQSAYGNISRSGLSTGDYYVVRDTITGSGVTSLDCSNGVSILGIGSTFIDNVYRVDHVVKDVNSGIVTVYSNVKSISGIGSTSQTRCGYYSWGKLNFNSRAEPKAFNLDNRGLAGIATAPIVIRSKPLLESY